MPKLNSSSIALNPPDAFVVTTCRNERRIVAYLIGFTVLLASITAAFGYSISPSYVGAAYNIDDNCVYYSWTRQAADGHFFIHNLFTTDPQNAIQFNVFMLSCGLIVRLTGAPIPLVMTVVRILSSVALLNLIYHLFRRICPYNPAVRLYALFFACLGSGFGYVFLTKWFDTNAPNLPVDVWQPEAFTFQSIDMSALFAFSQILIVAILYFLVLARQSGQMRFAVYAGLCALTLGNVHSYDILHVGAAWFVFLVVDMLMYRSLDAKAWSQALTCGLMAVPSVAYQLHMYFVDPVFHQRAEDSTLSPYFRYYVLGYGLVFILGAGAALHMVTTRLSAIKESFADRSMAILPICWFAAAMAIIFTPHCAFQRKMIMGADIPLSLLAGYGLWLITAKLNIVQRSVSVAVAVILCIPTTLLFVARDLNHIIHDRSETQLSPFLDADEKDMLTWIRQNTASSEAILGYPNFTVFVPGWCNRPSPVSHWGETPHFAERYGEFQQFVQTTMPSNVRDAYFASTKATYFVFPNILNGITHADSNGRTVHFQDFRNQPDLTVVHANSELTLYRIILPNTK